MTGKTQDLAAVAKWVTAYLVAVSLASLVLGFALLQRTGVLSQFLAVAVIGVSGSAVAALTSCLDRYANGFELDDGSKEPAQAKGETFNRRMARWFYVRPFLGFVMAPVLIWGLAIFVREPSQFEGSTKSLAFTAFLGGLLAKSVIELIKSLFKNVFKA